MRLFPVILSLLLLSLSPVQGQQYNFKNYSVAEGLPQSQVYTLCEDQRGYLWMGTRGSGACRFDGMTFTTYTEEDGLVNNYIRCIYEDKKGTLWFGTDEGLSSYNGKTFKTYKYELPDHRINCILEDLEGKLWIGTEGEGICILEKDHFTVLSKKDGMADNKVFCIYQDKNQVTWIGTEGGLSSYKNGAFTNYTVKQGLPGNVFASAGSFSGLRVWKK